MAAKNAPSEPVEQAQLSSLAAGLIDLGRQRSEELMKVQSELFEELHQTNRQWMYRLQSEAKLASDFATHLTAARTLPDAMAAYQQWSGQRLQMMAEDGKHLFSDGQKFMRAGARLMSGWLPPNATGSGTGT